MTALNIFFIAKKSPPYIDLAIFNNSLRLLIAFVLILDIWSFQLRLDYKVMPRFITEVVFCTTYPPLSLTPAV